jgi:rSAM/selenodomain-associated transferase 2
MSTGLKTSLISVIIPALDEETHLGRTLASLDSSGELEIIVVDGSSSDKTAAIAAAHKARVLTAPRGRARQMNAGAAAARGELLLFLHADTLLPREFGAEIRLQLARPGIAAGAFRLAISGKERGLRLVEGLANWRASVLRMPYGDQALFMKAGLFRELGGFPDQPFMEDFALVRTLRRRGGIAIAEQAVTTSGRRWQQRGVFRTTLLNQLIIIGYLLGCPLPRLERWYRGSH